MARISGPPKCPTCGAATKGQPVPGGRFVRVCGSCGWGQDRLHAIQAGELLPEPKPEDLVPSREALAVYWVGGGLTVAAAVALMVIFPAYALHIAGAFAIYLVASNVLTPKWDASNLGLMGLPIDNPLSFEDDWNRFMLWLAIVFVPGKLLGRAVTGTIKASRSKS